MQILWVYLIPLEETSCTWTDLQQKLHKPTGVASACRISWEKNTVKPSRKGVKVELVRPVVHTVVLLPHRAHATFWKPYSLVF